MCVCVRRVPKCLETMCNVETVPDRQMSHHLPILPGSSLLSPLSLVYFSLHLSNETHAHLYIFLSFLPNTAVSEPVTARTLSD